MSEPTSVIPAFLWESKNNNPIPGSYTSILDRTVSRAAYVLALGWPDAFHQKFAGPGTSVMIDSRWNPIQYTDAVGRSWDVSFIGPSEAATRLGLDTSDRNKAALKFILLSLIWNASDFSDTLDNPSCGDRVLIIFENWYFFGTFNKDESGASFFSKAGLVSSDRTVKFLWNQCAIVGNPNKWKYMKIVMPISGGGTTVAFEWLVSAFAVLGPE